MALSFALAACAGEASDVPVPVAATAAIYATLLPEGGDTTVDMLPQETRTLTVRLLAAPSVPIPRSAVQFALVDSAKGASLDAQSAVTDADGRGQVRVTSGTAGGSFKLRVSAEGALPLEFAVSVHDAVDPSLRVAVSYGGERPVAQRTVTVVPSMTCAQVLAANAVGDTTYSLGSDADRALFAVGSGMRYAVAAWGRDDTGGRLARGCVEQVTGISAERVVHEVDVALSDEPYTLAGEFPAVLDIPLDGLGAALAEPLASAVADVLAARALADEPALYVDAVRRAYLARGGTAPQFLAVGQKLTEALAAGGARFADVYRGLIDARNASLSGSLRLGFGAKAVSLSLDSLQCTDATAMWNVSLATGGAAIDAAFDATRAEVRVGALTLPLSLAELGAVLLSDQAQHDVATLAARIAPLLPCAGLPAIAAADTSFTALCDGACTAAACVDSAAELLRGAEAMLTARAPELVLAGSLATHARDTSAVSDLGPSPLSASFGDVFSSTASLHTINAQNAATAL